MERLDDQAILKLAQLSKAEAMSISTGTSEFPENLVPLRDLASAVVEVRRLIPEAAEMPSENAAERIREATKILDSVLGRQVNTQKTSERIVSRLRRHRESRSR